ncbi:MAG: ROK family protein [Clostridiaceae bacterium]|nr:ROK family protein [Clostridiaceae bacterium]
MKIGIDLGGSHISVGVISEDGKVLTKQEKNILFTEQKNDEIKNLIRDTIISLINAVLRDIKIPIFLIDGIGIGIPGIIENNKIKKCNKFKIYDWDLAKELEDYYDVNVKLENDALCAATAEKKYGNLKDSNKSIFLCLGTGIGSAIGIDNNVITSEMGHMIIKKDEQSLCNCGKNGCFETYCSMKSFKNNVIELLQLNKDIESEEIRTILTHQKDNRIINNYITQYIDNLTIGISNIINILNPTTICIGGGFIYFKEILFQRLLERLECNSYQFDKPKIILAKLENDAGMIGATLI